MPNIIETQLSLFADSKGTTPPAPEAGDVSGVDTDVTRVVRSSLVMRPVYELSARRLTGQDEAPHPAWDHLDVIWLAFATLDVISELTEFTPGVTRKNVISRLFVLAQNQARAMKMDIEPAALEAVLHKIFDHLANRDNRYRPFEYTYFDAAARQMVPKKFWLIKTVYTDTDQAAHFHLTDEGYTAYFGLYETGALDAAAIGNLRIQLLIDRGKVDDAIGVALQNRKQLLRKSQEIQAMGRAIRRSINRVDVNEINAMADDGAQQTRLIQTESARLNHLVRKKLAAPDTEQDLGGKLSLLGDALEKLNTRLLTLSGQLQELPEIFDRHSHKLFRRPGLGIFPACEQILNDISGLYTPDGEHIGMEFMARFDPAVCRPLFDPASLMSACDRALERRNQAEEQACGIQEIDAEPMAQFESRLAPELMDQAFELLTNFVPRHEEVTLSTLLQAACHEQYSPLMPVALAMAVFHCLVDPFYADKYQVTASRRHPELIFNLALPDKRNYRGHELTLESPPPKPRSHQKKG
nr:hypothetical protein [uncultured Desulfobacter sp.]